MDIRPATLEDAERINALCDTLGYPATIEETEVRIERVMKRETGGILVAELCNMVVGFVTYHVIDIVHDGMPWGRISAIAVDENFRDMSIGKQLLEAAEYQLKLNHCMRIEVTSHISREEAHGFYLHLGYRITPLRFIKLLAQRMLVAAS
ncbi:GNAT family N-acetyltransferase [Enterovibrio nigricans]|uniref:Ribosomal protein S18 acetylase RimI n=1 Tax=Enterovibrio nigricans DSM 22720 TaxID=1121868 RepID=A0A1T4UDT8_9GAMM|nr:GNAT family N-acetyltransferase [Enterovibrio nigricans]PKF50741.1 N-acetyltransferase [Enterovibrio nigricans]SKA50849.1 Ribosomal protein S18 acetylase RimI [Enterovibrio nigricans DSM 22720]